MNNRIYNEVISLGDPLSSLLVHVRWKVLHWTRDDAAAATGIPKETIAANERPRTAEGTRFHNRIFHAILQAWEQNSVPKQYCTQLISHLIGTSRSTLYGAFQEHWLREGIEAVEEDTGITKNSIDQVHIAGMPIPYRTITATFAPKDGQEIEATVVKRWRNEAIAFDIDRHIPAPLAMLRTYLEQHYGTTAYVQLQALGMKQPHARRLASGYLVPWENLPQSVQRVIPASMRNAFEKKWRKAYATECKKITFRSEAKKLKAERGYSGFTLARLLGLPRAKRFTSALRLPQEETGCMLPGSVAPGVLAHLLGATEQQVHHLIHLYGDERREFYVRTGEQWSDLRHEQELWGADDRSIAKIAGKTARQVHALLTRNTPLPKGDDHRIRTAVRGIGARKCDEAKRRADEYRSPTTVPSAIQKCAELAAQGRGQEGYLAFAKRLPGIAPETLRAIAEGRHVPAWPVLVSIVEAGGGKVNEQLRADWAQRFSVRLQKEHQPLVRVLSFIMQETAKSITEFSADRSRFSCSVPTVLRKFPALDRGEVVHWQHVERILIAADIRPGSPRWRFVQLLWSKNQDVSAALRDWRKAVQGKKRLVHEDFRSLPGITQKELSHSTRT